MPTIAAALAVNRFGLGGRPGEMTQAADDPRRWLTRQLEGPAPLPPGLAGLPPASEPLGRLRAAYRDKDKAAEQEARRYGETVYRTEVAARLRAQVASTLPFRERLAGFWSNHFTVSRRRGDVTGLACAFEREAIRPHVAGRFRDMLGAVVRHPAMLVYLDNQSSIGPQSREGRNRGVGLNENLARELLELHTLGVAGGYGQADVTELARILTGWRVDVDGGYRFVRQAHEPGGKTLLGNAIPHAGRQEGERALDLLAAHPSTARHVAMALARHFVAEPPPALIDRLSRSYLDHDGDLAAVTRSLVAADEAWVPSAGRGKTPNELVVSALRALDAGDAAYGDGRGEERILLDLRGMGQAPFDAPSPAGWPDEDAAWLTPEALVQRMAWALWLGGRIPDADAAAALDAALGPLATAATRTAVARAPSRQAAVAMLVAGPDFQRR